ncbi:MAG: hypothetical protein M0D57_07610 [Sphingobacteriales bacterium JAD_PAG50586_3]|nr:MAG: hypothetical protein M0D57_07610 [Sphingobacteriales bacterium JAD_PAG50586_3]
MNPTVKSVLGVFGGLIIGSAVNMALVSIGPMVIPPPAGADFSTMEGLEAAMPLMEPKHFVFPLLAHALGTLVGAFIAALIATTRKLRFAMIIGVAFLIGGVLNIIMLPSPVWFTLLDVLVAYLPMAYLGYITSLRFNAEKAN